MEDTIKIDKEKFAPGESGVAKISVSRLPSGTPISIRCHVYRSVNPGPKVLVIAGIHGDEINGIEIVRRSMGMGFYDHLDRGTVIVIPLMNIYGFINFQRVVPDGKDVNRSFPGTMAGSLAARVAATLTRKILPLVDYALDFHTGGASRFNYPQIRYTTNDEGAKDLGIAFGAPFLIQKGLIPKSFRKTAHNHGVKVIVFEAGESIRLSGYCIEHGVDGIQRVLKRLKMINRAPSQKDKIRFVSRTGWIRASEAGIFIWSQQSGNSIKAGDVLGEIHSPQGDRSKKVIAKQNGYIIGHNNASVVNFGDALFHIGYDTELLN